ncbi:transcription termination/antitermination protein NusG [Parvularcula sp. ZS-1/3]|uniref:Transcription termination/antitermination protein NusG n=1 Tax=Parvularcula mediterranea TaxID=2732508 RepID=A0A7Y3W4F6_9PROT|nr:transcription termination/antitermination protein NusG [Parvularcula mediterranea]NNU15413.1 transcription termination/antitermination protein NusG [Parvularcula mediterranea]
MSDAKWYIVHAYSNFEKKVADAIKAAAEEKGLAEMFEEVMVPTEEVVEVRRGRKVNTERRYFPGYVLVKMVMNDQTYHVVNETNKVTGFLGQGKKPLPVSQKEVDRILGTMEESEAAPSIPTVIYEVGEMVKVIDGPFASFSGVVEDVDQENARLKVSVSIFGRATPVELEYHQVDKES